MRPFLREPLTYEEKLDRDADRRIERMDRIVAFVAGFIGVVVIWLIYNGKLWP